MLDTEFIELVQQIKELCSHTNSTISVAESCTGGMLAVYLTSVSGSSEYFTCGIVSYSNDAKTNMLAVSKHSLKELGAVSDEVAKEMAVGMKSISSSDVAMSITGIAGPKGATQSKPVGTVCFGIAYADTVKAVTHHFSGNRNNIRQRSCKTALKLIISALKDVADMSR